jgi:hypothetical protein
MQDVVNNQQSQLNIKFVIRLINYLFEVVILCLYLKELSFFIVPEQVKLLETNLDYFGRK